MSKRTRSPNAARRASFGRAERLRREAGDTSQPKPAAPRKEPSAERPDRQEKQTARRGLARDPSRHDGPPPLHLIKQRLARSGAADERRRLDRLEKQTRSGFNRAAERRRDTASRAEHDRKQEALQQKTQRIAEHQRRANLKRLERKRGEMKRAFGQAADRRRDAAQRIEHAKEQAVAAERQKQLQRRAAEQIEREQKQHTADQKAAQRRLMDAAQTRQKVARNDFRNQEDSRIEHHYESIKLIDDRENRALSDFDGRRKGLAGRIAELIPGRRAENDQKRADMVRGYESDRLKEHRDFEAFKERLFDREQKARLDHARELKELRALHRDERETSSREHAGLRPQLIEARARCIDLADLAHEAKEREQARQDQPRENVRPSGDFGRAASDHVQEPKAAPRELYSMGR